MADFKKIIQSAKEKWDGLEDDVHNRFDQAERDAQERYEQARQDWEDEDL